MGVETWGIIKKRTSAKRIQKYLKEKYTKVTPVRSNKEEWNKNLFTIGFYDKNDARGMYIIQHNTKFPANPEDYWIENGAENPTYYFNKTSFTVINLNYWGNSVKIIRDIVEHFGGGFICECDTHCIYHKVEGKNVKRGKRK